MSPGKVTRMVVDVDLKCSDCYKKVKKAINKIPEIRDQEYDVEKNKVKITVVSCCPDKIRDKLRYKGGTSIQKIEIVADKPKEPAVVDKLKTKPKPKEPETPKDDNKPKASPPKKLEMAKMIVEPPVQGYPQMYPPNSYPGYEPTYSIGGSPIGYVPQPQSTGYGYGHGLGYNHGLNPNSIHFTTSDYFSDENPQGCSIM